MLFLENFLSLDAIATYFVRQGMREEAARRTGQLYVRTAQHMLHRGISVTSKVFAYWVPGRIEVLGKHTDYAGGQSLLAASERGFACLLVPKEGEWITICDTPGGETVVFDLRGRRTGAMPGWGVYPATVVQRIVANFGPCESGGLLCFSGNLPAAAGMSSSSALIIAIAMALEHLARFKTTDVYNNAIQSREAYADYLGHVENGQTFMGLQGEKGVGTEGGSQDHLAICCSKPRHFLHADFKPTRIEGYDAVPTGLTFCIGCSGVKAQKATTARSLYNNTVARAQQVLIQWNRSGPARADSLGEIISSEGFDEAQFHQTLVGVDASLARRFEQFLNETQRYIPGFVSAIGAGDLAGMGPLVDASQADAERCLENQVPETVFLAKTAREGGALAASAFGAGFGGAVWALVDLAGVEAFMQQWRRQYLDRFPQNTQAAFFVDQTGPPAHHISRLDD